MDTNAKKVKNSLKRVRKTLSWSAMSKGAREAVNRSKSIDHQLEAEKEKKNKELLMLVLGGGGSGKSTFVKQLRLHCGDGFPEIERAKYSNQVFDNVATAANKVIENMDKLQIKFHTEKLKPQADDFLKRNPILNLKELLNQSSPDEPEADSPTKGANSLISMACSELTKRFTYLNLKCNGLSLTDQHLLILFWEDGGFQECFAKRSNFKGDRVLTPQEVYFLSNIKTILHENYIPSLQDILYIRKPTIGIIEHQFCLDSLFYRVIDVAGQKSQRKKWIHLFENATVVLFFVSLSAFDESLEEDETLNTLQDSLQTFHEVSHNRYLEKTDFLLFLNKHDLFVEKLQTLKLKNYLPSFSGENEAEACVKYIRELFHQHRPCHKQVYTHVSCATDVIMMKEIVAKVVDIVTEINLRKSEVTY